MNRLALTLLAAGLAGCTTGGHTRAGGGADVAAGATGGADLSLEEQYLVGPEAARRLDRRIVYQTQTHPEDGSGIRRVAIEDDAILVLDGRNFLSRIRREDGQRLWRLPVADPYTEIYGISYIQSRGLVLLTVGGDVLVLDRNTGSQVGRQPLLQMASTAPVTFGSFLIYGARNGQIVWHSYEVGHQWRGYEISSTVRINPILIGDDLIAIGADGRVIMLDASAAIRVWDKQLLAEVVAPPVAGHGMVYFAGLDQYVWALDLNTGRRVWWYLTESPLTTSPVLIGDRLYQQVPTEGLICFDAKPVDDPDGAVIWTAPVKGVVISSSGKRLLVWDGEGRRLTVVDRDRGDVVDAINLPNVQDVYAPQLDAAELYAVGADGRVEKLVGR